MLLGMAALLMACSRDLALFQTDAVTGTWHHWDCDIPAAKCLRAQDVKTRLAYVTRRKLHKAKREQQKKLQALEQRRQVCALAMQDITPCESSVSFAGLESCWSNSAVIQSFWYVTFA